MKTNPIQSSIAAHTSKRTLAKIAGLGVLGFAFITVATPSSAICVKTELPFDSNLKTCFQEGENGTARGVVQNGVRAIFVSLQQDTADGDLAQVNGIKADGSRNFDCQAWTFNSAPAVAGDPDFRTDLQGDREGVDLNGNPISFDGSCNQSATYILTVYNPEAPQD